MRREFLLEIGKPDDYNYISGRIKILETALFNRETFERCASASPNELKQILLETPYKSFIKGDSIADLSDSIFERFNYELDEMSRYVSPGFIYVFFRNSEIFLKLKKWALVEESEEKSEFYAALKTFVHSGGEDFPQCLYTAFNEMLKVKDNPLEVGIVLDIYRIKFLMEYADLTGSELIKSYYRVYSEVQLKYMLLRISRFIESSLIDDRSLSLTLSAISNNLSEIKIADALKSVKELDEFKEFVSSNLDTADNKNMQRNLMKILEKGKFISMGIEVVFTYLKQLEYEVSTLSMILSGKQFGMQEEQILEKVAL